VNRLLVGVFALALTLMAAAPAGAKLRSFQSPSKNIGCIGDGSFVRCDIREKDWSTSRPKGCPKDSDYGQGLAIGRRARRGGVVCAGDTALNAGKVLGYGKALKFGNGLRCKSMRSGVRCRNKAGHGFKISRQSYRLF
jgi:hypothetical protein